jgi:phage baseplate assembly protein W
LNKTVLNDNLVEKLGSDLKMPIKSVFEPISGTDLLNQDIQILLLTSPGERVNNPQYGCGLNAMIWENMDEAASKGSQVIKTAITKFEPRISLLSVTSRLNRNTGLIIFIIKYVEKATGSIGNLVFPLRPANQLA